MNKIVKIIGVLLISVFLTVASVFYESTYSTVEGNVCCSLNCKSDYCTKNPERSCEFHPECYKEYPTAGFPVAFVYDQTGVSVTGELDFYEYLSPRLRWFFVDIIFYFTIFYLIYFVVKRFYKSKKEL